MGLLDILGNFYHHFNRLQNIHSISLNDTHYIALQISLCYKFTLKLSFNVLTISFIDRTAARQLTWLLKTLLGLDAFTNLVLLVYGTLVECGEVLINSHKTKSDKLLVIGLGPGAYCMWRCFFITSDSSGDRILVRLERWF